ncbi:MAG: DUF2071 domain-containing protein [Chitinophagaceae bacterium]|nr:MAG: DUF2071 domain-containing protein [Chitinophagaceae bacterium]
MRGRNIFQDTTKRSHGSTNGRNDINCFIHIANLSAAKISFYVRYKENGQWKRGVVFLKEIVPKQMITFVANTLYGENYTTHRMKHQWTVKGAEIDVSYSWLVNNEWNYLKAVAERESQPLKEGSEEEFITEHYWGYTFVNETCSGTYQVSHPRWRVHKVNDYSVHCNTKELYGAAFAEALQQKPSSVFLAEGSPISVMRGSNIFKT